MSNGEIVYQGTVAKLQTMADGGWRIIIDFPDREVPAILVRDTVAVALLKSGDGSPQAG
jgi:hypothetical protein